MQGPGAEVLKLGEWGQPTGRGGARAAAPFDSSTLLIAAGHLSTQLTNLCEQDVYTDLRARTELHRTLCSDKRRTETPMAGKSERLEVRLSADHKSLVEMAAALTGQTLSSFVVSEVLARARAITADHELTLLSPRDWDRFLEVLDREEEATPALVAAARKHRRREG